MHQVGGAIRIGVLGTGISLFACLGGITGCGSFAGIGNLPISGSARTVDTDTCNVAPNPATAPTLVVLDWTGGESRMLSDKFLNAFNIAAMNISDDRVDQDTFQDLVLARLREILCSLEPMDVAVIHGESQDFPDDTIVHITGHAPFTGGKHIGQSSFDPCNSYSDDYAIIWGGAMAERIAESTLEEWVNVVANATAHEIGHTLGFFHPSDDLVARQLPDPTAEIMRARITISELKRTQSFHIHQDTCPGATGDEQSYELVDRSGAGSLLDVALVR